MEKIPTTCKAAVLARYGAPLELREVPVPEVEPGGILVRTEMAGVCGTDVHIWRGTLTARLPTILGHETVGRIIALGEAVHHDAAGTPLEVGDRIIWTHVACGTCYWCRIAGQANICPNRKMYAYSSCEEPPYLLGGFAELVYVLPGAGVVKIPEEVPNAEVVGACCALRSVIRGFERLGGLDIASTVAVQGSGPVGLYAGLIAKERGAGRVIVIGAPAHRLELARRWGADHAISIEELPDPAQRTELVKDLTDGRGPDVVVECSGAPTAFNEGLEMIRPGGRYLMFAPLGGPPTTVNTPLILRKDLFVIASWSAEVPSYVRAVRFVRNKRSEYPLGAIVSSTHRLEGAYDALSRMATQEAIKAVIVPQ